MGKRFAKFVSYLLVIVLVMQDGLTAAAANNLNGRAEMMTVLENDSSDSANDKEETDDKETPLEDEELENKNTQEEEKQDDRASDNNEKSDDKDSENEKLGSETSDNEKSEVTISEEESDSREQSTENKSSEDEQTTEETSQTEESIEEETTGSEEETKTEETETEETKTEETETEETENTTEEEIKKEERIEEQFLYPGDTEEYGENMLPDDVFRKDGDNFAYWGTDNKTNITSVEPTEDKKGVIVQFGSGSLGADWLSSIYLAKDDFKLENGHTYEISYKIISTKARTFQSGFDGTGDRDAHQYELKADTETEITYRITTDGEWKKLMFYLGKVGNDMSENIGEHSITISDLSIKEVTIKLEDGEAVEENPDNLLTNGTFKDGTTDGWNIKDANTSVKKAKYKVVFDMTGVSGDDWTTWLQQDIQWESSTKYKITFDATSTVDRYIMAGSDGGTWLQHKELKANVPTKVEYQVTGMSGGNFVIALGSNLRASSVYKDWEGNEVSADAARNQSLEPHRVVISNVCVTEITPELPDTPNDKPYAKITNLRDYNGYTPSDLVPLKDGKFTQSVVVKAGENTVTSPPKASWSMWHEAWMTQWKDEAVTCTPVEDGVAIYIETTGGGEGNKPWDVQLGQQISLASNTEYVLSFQVTSEKARSINVSIADIGENGTTWIKPIAIKKGETREVILNLPVLTQDAIDKTFQIQMGNVAGNVSDNTLTFTDMKLEVNGYSEIAEQIADGYFDNGDQGTFTVIDNNNATISFADNYIKADVTTACNDSAVVVSSGTFDLLGPTNTAPKDTYNYEYEVSFIAGAVDENRTIKAVLEDGSGNKLTEQSFELTIDAEKYSFIYKPTEPKKNVVLKLLLGGSETTICVDTIRCDLKGYPKAAGLDTTSDDITLLEKNTPPVISEMPADQAIKDQNIVISFNKEGNDEYKNAIRSIFIDGTEVEDGKYTIEERNGSDGRNSEYIITLDKSLFSVNGERQTFTIEVKADWYQNNRIRQTVYAGSRWNSTWLEEFDGTALDMSKWSYQIGTGDNNDGWGNNEQQCYTDSASNLQVGNGELTITAQREKNDSGRPYTSARIWTMEEDGKTAKFSQTYGRMEAKMKLAGGEGYQGVWPAFWMLPVDLHYGAWPLSGEIDILEARGREPNLADGTVHYGKPWPNNESQGGVFDYKKSQYNQDSDINDYHIYAVEWEPGEIRWYVDDELYFTYSNWYCQSPDNPDKFRYPAPFDQDFYIILNLAIGGTFDNMLNPDNDKLPVDMKVDYVRVYESVDGYEDVTEEPPVIKDEDTSISAVKSELYDANFEGINIITEDGVDLQRNVWNLVTLPSFGGSADFTTITQDGKVYAKITPKSLGSAAHAIQLIQHLDLVKGYNYRISFDAWTEASRKLNMKIGQDGTEGWNTYQTFETSLTTSPQHYKYEFQSGVTDLHSRVEFNLATSNQPVYIGNIKYEVIDEITIDPDAEKKPSENGNCVYNGSFDVGKIDGLSYWHMDNSDGKVVRDGKGYVFTATKGSLYQDGLELLQSDSYKLTFSADAVGGRTIKVILSDKDGKTKYAEETIELVSDRATKELTFTMPAGVTDRNARLCFDFGEGSEAVHITDIWLKRTTYNNIEWDEVEAHPLLNGDFELGALYWSEYGNAQFSIETDDNGNHYAKVNAPQGGNKWDALLIYDGLAFTAKTDYEFSFDVKASEDGENIRITMEDSGYYAHYEQKELEVGKEWKHYEFDVRFTDNQNLALKFQTGGANNAHEVYFDNVVLRAKGAPKAPGIITTEKYNRLGTDIVLSYDGEEDWVKNAVVYIDNERIDADKAVFQDGKLTLDKSVFSESKAYTLVVRSEGYTVSRNVNVVIYPADGNRILNGRFLLGKNGLEYWDQYVLEAERDIISVENGEAKIHYGGPGYDQWGNIVSWAIQFFQDNIPVENGKRYQLSFIAYATTERRIQVMRNQGQEISEYMAITKEPKLYELEFDSTSDNLKLQFLLSTVAKEDGADITKDDVLDVHDIFLDNICIKEMENGVVPVYKSTLENLVAEYSTIQNDKDKYTEETYSAFLTAYEAAKEVLADDEAKQVDVNRAEENLRKAKEGLKILVNKDTLNILIAECEALKEENYSKESWEALMNALKAAKEVAEDSDATQEAVKEAYDNLEKAKESLIPSSITTADLESLIADCETLDKDKYTSESWEAFDNALKTAKGVAENPDATQDEIDNAYKALVDAKVALILAEPETPEDKTKLNNLIEECKTLKKEEYTDESWIPFEKALKNAESVLGNSDASQQEIQDAYDALEAAKLGLRKIGEPQPVNKDQLMALISKCETLKQVDYEKDSWNIFAKALADAKAVAENEAATQEDIQNVTQRLSDAFDQLKEREGLWAFDVADVTYTGKALKPNVTVYDGKTELTQGKDYTVSYKKNTKVTENAEITIKGKGNYTGTIRKIFKIVPKNLAEEDIVIPNLYVMAPKAGKNVVPAPVVTRSGKKLAKKEYAVGNIKDKDGNLVDKVTEPGTYTVAVNGIEKNGYIGTKEIQMTVLNQDQVLMSAVKVSGIKNMAYTGEKMEPQFTVKYGKNTLTPNVDYAIICDSKEIGTATAIIKGIGETYIGEKTVTFKITGTVLKAKDVTLDTANAVYTGSEIKPTVTIAGAQQNRDYIVAYDNNIKAGTATVTVKGIGSYSGTVKKTFKIAAADINEINYNKEKTITVPYRKGGSKVSGEALDIKFGGVSLVEGVDYTFVYAANKKVGTATVKIKGKGNFKGTTAPISFTVEEQNIANLTDISAADILKKKAKNYKSVSLIIKDFDGKTLKKGTDFEVKECTNEDGAPIDGIPNVGDTIRVEVGGIKNYTGTTYAYFRIIDDNKSISKATVKIEPQIYAGKEIKLSEKDPITGEQQITVTMKVNGVQETLKEGTDYEIVETGYSQNINKGTGKMTIRGINNYGGTKTVPFKIMAHDLDSVTWYGNLYSRTMSWFNEVFSK